MKVIDQALLEKVIIERSCTSHKGDYGRLLLLGGTYPYGGAIIMATLAAVKSGAGLVTIGTDRENISALHSHLPDRFKTIRYTFLTHSSKPSPSWSR